MTLGAWPAAAEPFPRTSARWQTCVNVRDTETFGNGPAPHTSMPYHRTKKNDYWVGDNTSPYYNRLRNRYAGGFRWWLPQSNRNASERLRAHGAQYRYVAVINFNRPPDTQRAYRGFAASSCM